MVAMADPIGIYFERFDGEGEFETTTGSDVPVFWRFSRGSRGRFTRLEFEVPPGAGCVLGDIRHRLTKQKIRYGAQLAALLKVKVTVQAIPFVPRNTSPLWSFIAGRNTKQEPLTPEFISAQITDYFGQQLIRTPSANQPRSLRQVIKSLPPYSWVPFVIHEGLHIPKAGELKKPRIVVIATPNKPSPGPPQPPGACAVANVDHLRAWAFKTNTLFIVGGGDLDNNEGFLQCAAFDQQGWFNFYEVFLLPFYFDKLLLASGMY